jgi:hypothetical protein
MACPPDIDRYAIVDSRVGVDSRIVVAENDSMEIQGRVHNGVVVPDQELSLPDGTLVTVVYPVAPAAKPEDSGRRVRLPMVRSDRPGSLRLDADRVAELLDGDDVPT